MENKLEPQKSSLQALEPSVLNWMKFSMVYEQEEEGERGGPPWIKHVSLRNILFKGFYSDQLKIY